VVSQIDLGNTVGFNHFVPCVCDRQPDSQSITDHILAQSFTLRQRQQMKIWLVSHTQAHLAFTSHEEAWVIGAWVWNIQNNPSDCMMIDFINGTADEVKFKYFVNIIMSDSNVVYYETITTCFYYFLFCKIFVRSLPVNIGLLFPGRTRLRRSRVYP
jgi:hypothetical protein